MSPSSFFTKPWFVASIVFGCFFILTPKILIPIFKQLFGIINGQEEVIITKNNNNNNFGQRSNPSHSNEKIQTHNPFANRQNHEKELNTNSSTSRSVLIFILPIYAIGIAVYMIFTLCKVYNKKQQKQQQEDEQDDFLLNNIKWDPINKRFLNENEYFDEENEYKNLDDDYVEFLKSKRRNEKLLEIKTKTNKNEHELNDVLNLMKSSLNNINVKLVEAEKKGGPMDDNDLQTLRLQLANTELQMVKILKAIDEININNNKLENEIKNKNCDISNKNENLSNEEDEEEDKNNNNDDESLLSTTNTTKTSTETDSDTNFNLKCKRRNRKLNKNKVKLVKNNESSCSENENNIKKNLRYRFKKSNNSTSGEYDDDNNNKQNNEI